MFAYLKIEIASIDRSHYPEFATFYFIDSNNSLITVTEKLDILTATDTILAPISGFFVKCKILEESSKEYLIDISKPFGILSENNESTFRVRKEMISTKHFDDLFDPEI